jgi:SprT-like family
MKHRSSWHLRRMYNHFNRKRFGGRLPSDTALLFRYCQGNLGETEFICRGVPAVINIAPIVRRVGWDVVAMTMLHEMVHLDILINHGARDGHGKRFQARMRELANAGAFERYW